MRPVLYLVLFFLSCGTAIAFGADLDLTALYSETGAVLAETEFQAWLRIADTETPVDKLLADITTQFGYQITGSIEKAGFQEDFEQAFAMVDFFEAEGWMTVQRMHSFTVSSQVETYIGLRALRQGAWQSLAPYRARVTSEYQTLGASKDIQFFTTLIGTIAGELESPAREKILRQVSTAAEAELVETFTQGELATYSFFTRRLPDRLPVENKYINLHLAFRYNEYEDQTYVYLGTPIIAPDY